MNHGVLTSNITDNIMSPLSHQSSRQSPTEKQSPESKLSNEQNINNAINYTSTVAADTQTSGFKNMSRF